MIKVLKLGLIALVVSLAASCGGPAERNAATSVQAIRDRGELIVLTLEGPTTYRGGFAGATGYEVDLAGAFAADLGVDARFVVMPNIERLLRAIAAGEGDIAAAGLTATPARTQAALFGPAYRNVTQQLICKRGHTIPASTEEMAQARIAVVANSSYVETLETLRAENAALGWTARQVGSAMPLLSEVDRQRIDCTVSDSNLVEIARRRHPELVVALELTEEEPLGWALNPNIEGLPDYLNTWFAGAHDSGLLAELDHRWYGHFRDFDYVEVAHFIRRLDERLPLYQRYFEAAAEGTPFEWQLLAAQAYQESHWDADAVSPTGVRGLMMLTRSTAARVGVTDRTDPSQSVRGGAAYLAELYDRLPDDIAEEDRIWFALAAYNVGMGHLYDARRLADRLGRDKNSWADMSEVLPLLSQPEYYRTLRYGYARGHEPVRYVNRVREYHSLLELNHPL